MRKVAALKSTSTDIKARNLEAYGAKIRKFRQRANLSADELGKALNLAGSTVRNWESGNSRPDPEYLYGIFTALNVDPNEFFGVKGVGQSFTEKEIKLVKRFRSMDARDQDYYLAIGDAIINQSHTMKLREVRNNIVPLYDYGCYAAAGSGDGWSQDNEAEEVLLYNNDLVGNADEIITVSGHSMEPNYHDKDRILVKRCTDVDVGKVYVFSLRGQGFVIKEAAEDRLHSQNPDYSDIIPSEEDGAELVGQVIGIVEPSMYPSPDEISLYLEAIETLKD